MIDEIKNLQPWIYSHHALAALQAVWPYISELPSLHCTYWTCRISWIRLQYYMATWYHMDIICNALHPVSATFFQRNHPLVLEISYRMCTVFTPFLKSVFITVMCWEILSVHILDFSKSYSLSKIMSIIICNLSINYFYLLSGTFTTYSNVFIKMWY